MIRFCLPTGDPPQGDRPLPGFYPPWAELGYLAEIIKSHPIITKQLSKINLTFLLLLKQYRIINPTGVWGARLDSTSSRGWNTARSRAPTFFDYAKERGG